MLTLALLRHGKSSWADPACKDFDRPLNERGREAAALIGREIRRRELRFDLILASPSTRTKETIAFLHQGHGEEFPVEYDADIYAASAATLFKVAKAAPRRARKLLIVGHNPAMQDMATDLTGADPLQLRFRFTKAFPTAALAVFTVPLKSWRDLQPGVAQPEIYVKPKELATAVAA